MRALAAASVGIVLSLGIAGLAAADTGPWQPVGSDVVRPLDEGQGLAVIERPDGTTVRYTGIATIPIDVAARGWNHVGDPGAGHGYYVEPYQRDDRGAKLFRVQAPDGSWAEYTHELESWEATNNSFAAVSPDGRWLVAGEWGTTRPAARAPDAGRGVDGSGGEPAVRVGHPVRPAGAGPAGLRLRHGDAAAVLVGRSADGPVRRDRNRCCSWTCPPRWAARTCRRRSPRWGSCRWRARCGGEFETEGIDYDERDGTLRVIVLSPGVCVAFDSKTWRFRRG